MSELQEKLVAIQQDRTGITAEVNAMQVIDEPTEAKAVELLGLIKQRSKRIEELRKFFVSPLNDQVKEINNMFKMESLPLDELEITLKMKLKVFVEDRERKAREAAAKIEQERREAEAARLKAEAEAAKKAKKAGEPIPAPVVQPEQLEVPEVEAAPTSVRTSSGQAIYKEVTKVRVVDMDALHAAHPELFDLSMPRLNKMVAEGFVKIPGVEVYKEKEIAHRR